MAQEAGAVGAFPPPRGRVPNFDDPEDIGRTSLTVGLAIMAGFTTVMFGLRSYAKMTITPHWYTEDWTCIAAYGLWMCYVSTVLVMAHYGEGYHEWEVTKESYKEILRWLYIGSILYCPAAYCTKVTLLLLEARVFAVYEKVYKGVNAFTVLLLVCYLPIMLLKVVVCIPISAAWDSEVKPAHCLNQRKVFISDMCLGVLTDLVILFLPLALTFSLQMPLWTKVKVVALLSAGGVATGVSIYRLYKSILFLNPTDKTEEFVLLDITTALELAIGLICACLPTVNLLLRRKTDVQEPPPNRPRTAGTEVRKPPNGFSSWSFGTIGAERTSDSKEKAKFESVGHGSEDEWEYNPRATSLDGRRHGWPQHGKNLLVTTDSSAPTKKTNAIVEVQREWEDAQDQRANQRSHSPPHINRKNTVDMV